MGTVIGIDVGGSTTKIVGFKNTRNGEKYEMIKPEFVKASDPLTSAYGAFGKFTARNGLKLADIDRVMMTGVGSSFIKQPIYSLDCNAVSEFKSIGTGGLYLSGLDDAIVVSMGTGTALVRARKENGVTETDYLGGTGVGGGTLVGLCKTLTGVGSVDHIEELCEKGDRHNVDLLVRDISNDSLFPSVSLDLTASNFGKISEMASKEDIAIGVANMVSETIAVISVFAARGKNLSDVVLTGNLAALGSVRKIMSSFEGPFGIRFTFPEYERFATVIGAALCGMN